MNDEEQNDEQKQMRDDIRCETTLQTLKDVLWRCEEASEGTYSLYNLVGFLVEDLIREGCCAACINETMNDAFKQVDADPSEHREDSDAVFH